LILWQSKENFFQIDNVLTSSEKYLIGYAYNENNYLYMKWSYLNSNENKSVWALGSSRVVQFRRKMFDASFYNAGYTILSINDFRPFIKSLPDSKHPKYIIVGLDQWMFNASYDSLNSTPSTESWQNSFSFSPKLYKLFTTYKIVYTDLFEGKYNFDSFLQHSNSLHYIGLNAIINKTGFRNDGSCFYGKQIVKLIDNDTTAFDFNYSDTFDRIKHGNRRFQYCKEVNERALTELNELLKYCKEKNINVIAFLPPFADKVFNKMCESDNYVYLNKIYNRIKPIFDKFNYEVYDFSKVSLCNSNDNEALDGIHGGELTYQKILISILDSGSILNKVTNVKRLRNDLTNKKNNYIIYDN
jgi:hypothetical protein